MKPNNLNSKIFLDSGDPQETQQALELLGFLDGQTTNPSLVAKNPDLTQRIKAGNKLTKDELLTAYKSIVQKIHTLIPGKSISIEVYVDATTSAEEIVTQALEMNSWIDSAHIKIPTITNGLIAAEQLLAKGLHLNFTLVFSQEQAAAVGSLAQNISKGDVFISPFEGRLHDRGKDGMDLIENMIKMYQERNSMVEILAASIRDVEHLQVLLAWGVDIVTVPFKILQEWVAMDMYIPTIEDLPRELHDATVENIPYLSYDLNQSWRNFNISHPMTDEGLKKFTQDWNNLLQ